jgi:hypothetical protein
MKVCEFCGGTRFIVIGPPKKLCSFCRGTGVIALGPEALDKYLAKVRQMLVDGIRDGSLRQLRDGGPWIPIIQSDLDEFDAWFRAEYGDIFNDEPA